MTDIITNIDNIDNNENEEDKENEIQGLDDYMQELDNDNDDEDNDREDEDDDSNLELATTGSTKSQDPSILTDLKETKISDDVRQKAYEIYCKMQCRPYRARRRQMLTFYCIYNAYKELGISKNPNELITLVGLDKKYITQAFALFNNNNINYKLPDEFEQEVTPNTFIDQYFYLTKLDKEYHLNPIHILTNDILTRDPSLLDKFPQEVALAILIYYMKFNKVKYDIKDYSNLLNKSPATLTNLCTKITRIYRPKNEPKGNGKGKKTN